jgi:hypothetical protein
MPRDSQAEAPFHRYRTRRAFFAPLVLAVSVLCAIGIAAAIDGARLEVAAARGTGWRASDIAAELSLAADGLTAQVSIGSLELAGYPSSLRAVRVDCGAFELAQGFIACRQAQLAVELPDYGPQTATGEFVYDRATGDVDVALAGLAIADGTVDVEATLHAAGWRIRANVDAASAAALSELAARFGQPLPIAPTAGRADAELQAHGTGDTAAGMQLSARLHGISAGNAAGTIAGEALDLEVDAKAERATSGWRFDVDLEAPSGQAYLEPVFVDLASGRINAVAQGHIDDDGRIEIRQFEIEHANAVRARGEATLRIADAWSVEALDLTAERVELPGAWNTYVAPFVLDTAFANLTTSGRLHGRVAIVDGAPSLLDVGIDSVAAVDEKGALAIADLTGELYWTSPESTADVEADEETEAAPRVSRLSWRSGLLFGLALGSSELRFTARGRGLRLVEPATVPVLDGAVELEALRVRNVGQENVAFLIGAEVQPISVALLCRAFGWPEFGGTLAGSIKRLRMRDGVVSLGTTLAAQVFDGEVRLSDLRLERPFDDWPRLFANIELENLDVEQVTSAFSFGRITGRIGGHITGLELFNWMPVAFDAALETPPGDRSKHRISQRAVENIGSLGGSSAGVTAALSSGFLRFFEDFNYDRLGITCRLRNEVCLMGGVASAENGGYYLVKGSGVPRIDVIGNRKRVDWPRLVRQLIAITESEGPVVE